MVSLQFFVFRLVGVEPLVFLTLSTSRPVEIKARDSLSRCETFVLRLFFSSPFYSQEKKIERQRDREGRRKRKDMSEKKKEKKKEGEEKSANITDSKNKENVPYLRKERGKKLPERRSEGATERHGRNDDGDCSKGEGGGGGGRDVLFLVTLKAADNSGGYVNTIL